MACSADARVFGLAADHQIRFAIDQLRQSLAHDRMVVHQKYFRIWTEVTSVSGLLARTSIASASLRSHDWKQADHRLFRAVSSAGTSSDPPIILAR